MRERGSFEMAEQLECVVDANPEPITTTWCRRPETVPFAALRLTDRAYSSTSSQTYS